MSSLPLNQPQQQQEQPLSQQQEAAYTSRLGHGSVGPVIAVLAVITILGIIAGLIGRLCSGRRVMGYGDYNCEGWLERKCASCIDGHVVNPNPNMTQNTSNGSGREAQAAVPEEIMEEREEESSKQVEEKPQASSSGS